METKIIVLAIIVFALFLITSIYFGAETDRGHSHGPGMHESEKAKSTNHETIN